MAGQGTSPSAVPQKLPVKELDREHPIRAEMKDWWRRLEIMYAGGFLIRQNAGEFLVKKPKELDAIYKTRIDRFTYQNLMGSGIDYYLASVFQDDPDIDPKTRNPDGTLEDMELPDPVKGWYANFFENSDRKGTKFVDVFRDFLKNILLLRYSWFLIDLPRPEAEVITLKDQQDAGLFDPYLISYDPQKVINWQEDDKGTLEWVIIKTVNNVQRFAQRPLKVETWYHFSIERVDVYRRTADEDGAAEESATLIHTGPHATTAHGRVPIVKVEAPEGLWLSNRVINQCMDHLNQDNSLGFALFQSNLAMPVVIGNVDETPVLSEAGYLKFPEGTELGWTEPPGGSFERSHIRVLTLREEIYRAMFLMAQGRSSEDGPAVQSGYSKELEMTPAGHIQNQFGDLIRVTMAKVLEVVSLVRQDVDIVWDVRGYQFVDDPAIDEFNEAMSFASLGIQSPKAQIENRKKSIRARFQDYNQTVVEEMCEEEGQSLSEDELLQVQEDRATEQFTERFKAEADQYVEKGQQRGSVPNRPSGKPKGAGGRKPPAQRGEKR